MTTLALLYTEAKKRRVLDRNYRLTMYKCMSQGNYLHCPFCWHTPYNTCFDPGEHQIPGVCPHFRNLRQKVQSQPETQ